MNKQEIVFIVPDLSYGGAQKTFCNIVNQLVMLRNDIKITLISLNKSKNFKNIFDAVNLVELQSSRSLFSSIKLIKYINKNKPKHIFSTTVHVNILCIMLKFLFPIKITIRESNPTFFRSDISKIYKFLAKFLYSFSDHIICLSEFVFDDIKKNVRIKNEKISKIYNPVDFNLIRNYATKKEINFNSQDLNLIYVGRISAQKNINFLIDIINNINLPNIKLRIIGKGPEYLNIISKVSKLKLKDKILFYDFKKNPLPDIANSDVFLLPSNWEGFGHVIAESLFLQTPVISINTSGIAKIFLKTNYFTLINSKSVKDISNRVKDLIIKYKKNKPKINIDFLKTIESKNIAHKYLNLINNL